LFIDAFDFLETDDIGRGLLQPGEKVIQALPDRIDVPGGYAHERVPRTMTDMIGQSRAKVFFRRRSGSNPRMT
jgi:hypothetical protein